LVHRSGSPPLAATTKQSPLARGPVVINASPLRGTRIGSFVASPNPVTPGSTTTLTAGKITVANRGASVARVAFYAHINGKQTLLGYGTQTTRDIWTLNLTVTLAAGSYFLHARARDSGGASGVSRPLKLTVGVGVDWSALRHG